MRWYRTVIVGACAIVTLFVLTGTALAGGWAVTTLDALPEGAIQAGQSYRVGFTIRQHGQTPVVGARTAITITSPSDRARHVFPGAPDGPPGHYIAEVTFPSGGVWDWEVTQEPFPVQPLGAVTVAPAAPAAPAPGEELAPTAALPSILSAVVVSAALLLALVVAWPLIGLIRRRRVESEPRLVRAR